MGASSEQERSLAHLLVSVMNTREQEGARFSRLLHDEVGQVLSAIGLQMDLLRMDLEEGVTGAPKRILEIQKFLEQAVAHVRDLSYELNPSIVERTGLKLALERLAGRCRRSFPGNVRLTFDPAVRVPIEIATALYKIAEQALDNALRHAHATRIAIAFKAAPGGACLEIRDNGVGFAVEKTRKDPPGLGLLLMSHHAARAGLRLTLACRPEKGTIVKAVYRAVKLPVRKRDARDGARSVPGRPSGK